MNDNLAQQAVSAALSGDWQKAIEINKKILITEKEDVDALNRLARAYCDIGDISKARETAKKVLVIDSFNPIASKSLEKWKGLKKGDTTKTKQLNADAFLEEPGKTKVISLVCLGDRKLLAKIDSGDEVKVTSHAHRTCITTEDGKYIGRFADNLAARLRTLIQSGNEYKAYIKYIDTKEVKIFIREMHRSNKFRDTPSFPPEKIDYISFTPPELVHDKEEIIENVTGTEEND